jgi:hypothetical protein
MSAHAYPARHRATPTVPPALHRPIATALALLVTLFAVSMTAGWRLAGNTASAADMVSDLTAAVPSSGTVKAFAAVVLVLTFIRRNM